ncbi:hypothetical protein NSS91_07490 [Caldifermentibacillus hisashii]|uniref:hypothetical protein n=1 Tax=Caldifermentibacillus hisashii TaxID=996558 RepID=UPI0031FBE39A
MDELKEFILNRMETLHLKLYFGRPYPNTEEGVFDRLKDTIRYEQLKEVVRINPDWNNEEMGRELSKRLQKKTTL